jgi:hypothetical protein
MFDQLPPRRPWDHAIELTPGAKMVDCKIYPLNPSEQKQLDEFLKEQLETGRIQPSKSPMASPFFFVKKKDRTLRPVQDYQKLNEMTIKNRYPLPLISELIDKLSEAKYFSKMDVRWGYNNIRIKDRDTWKAAFRTNRGLFEPLVMFFGLTNSPTTFQTMMNDIFREEIAEGWVVIYMDDILVFSKDKNEHQEQVKRILEKLRQHQLSLKAEKCYFEKEEIEFLGLIISEEGIRMDPHKVKAITDWPIPTTKRELQQFLGFVNFYRRFVKGFAKIAKPLTKLTGKTDWLWMELQQKAFQELKNEVTSERVLIIPKPGKPFRMETDASDFVIAAILSQLDDEGRWRPVAFLSRSLNDAERNYEIYDKEMLAIMHRFYEWAHYLKGNDEITEVLTDHQNLTFFRKLQNLNRRQARWIMDLQEYNFTIKHRPGKANTKADLLSQRAGFPKGEKDNEDVILLKENHFRNIEIRLNEESREWLDLRSEIKKIHRRYYNKQVKQGIKQKDPNFKKDEFNDYWMWKERIYIPINQTLRERAIRWCHDEPMAGHPGIAKTLELTTRTFWWPNMKKDIEKYIKACHECQISKPDQQPRAAPLQPNEIPSEPWAVISIDLIGPLVPSKGKDMILVIIDRFSKKAYFLPCNTTITSQGVANLYRDHIFKEHGLPKKVISDRGSQFVSGFMKGLYQNLGIEANPSTAYHPQTDGQTERVNQELEEYLRIYVNEQQKDWVDWLPIAQFCHNDRSHSATGFSPFMKSRNT